jgi:hypothetical protein
MNLIGKIFTVVICVLAVIFMAMVLAIYAAHTNWRNEVERTQEQATAANKPLGLKYKLANEQKLVQELKDKLETITKEKDKELSEKTQALTELQNENKQIKDELKTIEKSLAEKDQSERKAVAALKATQDESAQFRTEVEGLRSEAEKALRDRDAHVREVVNVTDEMHQLQNELNELKTRNTAMASDMVRARDVLRHYDLSENTDISGTPPSGLDGHVTAVLGGGMTEISIGADQGLQKGHKLEVYRVAPNGNKYVGRIEVLKTSPDKSVCKVLSSFQQSELQKGDRVASKIE